VAGRQGGGREINEYNSETRKNQSFSTCRLEKGHLAPEVKTDNEITRDYVCNKL
jgi:hypothetical protein